MSKPKTRMPTIVTPELQPLVRRVWHWCCSDVRQLWDTHKESISAKYRRTSTREAHTLRLLLNDILVESDESTDISVLSKRVDNMLDHVREILKHSRASYEDLLTNDVLTVEDVALKRAMKQHTFREIFGE